MKNNLAIQNNCSEQADSSLSVAYKKTTPTDNVVSELEITTTETVDPLSKQRVSKKNTEKFYRQLVPVKIYNKLPAIEEAIKPNIIGYQKVHLLQIISIVAWHIRNDVGIARLHLKYLKDQVPQGDKYMNGLIFNNIVRREGQPIKGVRCYEYSFAPEYQSKYVTVQLNNMYLIRRLEQLQDKIEKQHRKSIWGHLKQKEFLKLLTIDAGFNEFLQSDWTDNVDIYNNVMASATRIIQHDYFCKRDNTSRRFHSNVTNMSKDLRPFLRVNGQPLVNIDIKNSQPYLSTLLLTHPEKVVGFVIDDKLDRLLKTIKIPKSRDIAHYIDLVTSGGIYEYLMAEFSKEGLIMDRKETKKQVLRILFARNREPKDEINLQARSIFMKIFPNVHQVFFRIRGPMREKKYLNSHNKCVTFRRFAILLQRIESKLVLDVIMKRVYKELPGVFVLTIHDSILTVNDREVVDSVFKIMKKELEKFVGFTPTIKIEGFCEGN